MCDALHPSSGSHDGKQCAERHKDDVGDVVQLELLHLRDAIAGPFDGDGCCRGRDAGHDEDTVVNLGFGDVPLHVRDEELRPQERTNEGRGYLKVFNRWSIEILTWQYGVEISAVISEDGMMI